MCIRKASSSPASSCTAAVSSSRTSIGCVANTRVPRMVAGDLNAEVVGVRTGANALLEVVDRCGIDVFRTAVERIFDHGES